MRYTNLLLLNFPITFFIVGQVIICLYEIIWLGRVLLKKKTSDYILSISFVGMFETVLVSYGLLSWILYYVSLLTFLIFLFRQKFTFKFYKIFVAIIGICLTVWFPFAVE